ncbi:ParA family protein [Vibrio fluvialis]|nr:ParA family protein [Vibrio fluvialis]
MNSTQTIINIASSLEALAQDNNDTTLTEETPNGKKERVYNQREAMEATGAHSVLLNEVCDVLGIQYNIVREGKRPLWRITLKDVQAIREHMGYAPFKRTEEQELAIWCTATLKGGAGKTTDTATLAIGLATEPMTKYRIGLIDLDPQGSLTSIIKPNLCPDDFTVGDLLIADFELDEGETFEQVCREAFVQTNIDNVRILPAGDHDRHYDAVVESRKIKANAEGAVYNAFEDLQRIIDAVKDEFDIILIDTPPQFNAAAMSGQYVANGLLIPLRPSSHDRKASAKYIKYLSTTDELLTGLGQRKKEDISVLISGVDNRSPHQRKSADEIRGVIGQWCFNNDFIQSDAVTNAAQKSMTVFDVSPSGFVGIGSAESLRSAQAAYRPIVEELEQKIRRTWGL